MKSDTDENEKRIDYRNSLFDPSLPIIGYALVGIYFTFFEGRIPLVPNWQVDQNIILGLGWTAILIPGALKKLVDTAGAYLFIGN
ncbi:MAG: hypothetical protein U5K69_20710 [Balneolaceae bacterium]|nr:hypothetical protein [Balneolaceae bacterium]